MRPSDDAALLIGFLNTAHLPDGIDALAGSGPEEWVVDGQTDGGRSLHPGRRSSRSPTTTDLRVLREGLRIVLARGEVDEVGRALVHRADAVLAAAPLRVSLATDQQEPVRVAPASGSVRAVAAVGAAALRARADGSLERVRICARPLCRWAFFDASRNRSRQWCSMAGCGNVEKNRAYRARRSAR